MKFHLIILVFLSCALGSCVSTGQAVDILPVRDVVQIVVGDFGGRYSDEIEQDLRQAISQSDLFVLVDPRYLESIRRYYNDNLRSESWRPIRGADAIIVGDVREHGVVYGEGLVNSAMNSDNPTAVVEVAFRIVDLRTGEDFGSRSVRSVLDPSKDPVSLASLLISRVRSGDNRRQGRSELSEQDLLFKAREDVVTSFVKAIRPVDTKSTRRRRR